MIDLTKLYEIAPELAPKTYKRISGQVKKIVMSEETLLDNPLRVKLLRNLDSFREYKQSAFVNKTYVCTSRKRSTFLCSTVNSLNSSVQSYRSVRGPVISHSITNKNSNKLQEMKKDMERSLESIKTNYLIDISSTLKSTIPNFLQTTRKKLLKNINK